MAKPGNCNHDQTLRKFFIRRRPVFFPALFLVLSYLFSSGLSITYVYAEPKEDPKNLWGYCPSDFVPRFLHYQPQHYLGSAGQKTTVVADQAVAEELETFQLSGDVQVRHNDLLVTADEVLYRRSADQLSTTGGIRFEGQNLLIIGDQATMSLAARSGTINNAQIWLPENHLRGEAAQVVLSGENTVDLKNALITSCPSDRKDWFIKASELRLDQKNNEAVAWHARLEVFNIPVLYSPYLSFPIAGRKSGFLAPEAVTSNTSGTELALPYYWNIAPNRDATITPRYYSKRGTQLQTEARYLNPDNEGKLYFEYLPDDTDYHKDRGFVYFQHKAQPTKEWSADLQYRYASDHDYLRDFGGDLTSASTEYLERRVNGHYQASAWSANFLVLNFQSLSPTENSATPGGDTFTQPYSLLPQVRYDSALLPLGYGLQYQLNTELVRFDRQDSLVGRRVDLYPQLQWPMRSLYGFFTPTLAIHHTRYHLQHNLAGSEADPTRSVPRLSVDSGLYFERDLHWGSAVLQTLEPRLFYLYVPYRDQSRLLLDADGQEQTFDSAATQLSMAQMFRDNRYSGLDRIGDANQISLSVNSRFYNELGKELFSMGLGQIYYFQDRRVTLPGEQEQSRDHSDVILELRSQWAAHTDTSASLLWDDLQSQARKGSLKFRYRKDQDRMLSLAYRYEADTIDQADATIIWPLRRQWKILARWYYSLRDRLTLENIEGLQYDSCCWALRLGHRRYVTQIEQSDYQDKFFLQFELKGLANVGSDIDQLFTEGVLDSGS